MPLRMRKMSTAVCSKRAETSAGAQKATIDGTDRHLPDAVSHATAPCLVDGRRATIPGQGQVLIHIG